MLEPAHESLALALFSADGPALDELCRIADDLRAQVCGPEVTYVVNRNINFSNVCYVGCRFCAFAQRESDADAYRLSVDQVADRAEQAWQDGASEVCMQGGIDPKMPVTAYAETGSLGSIPPCMQTSVAPAAQASSARSATCRTESRYASASRSRWANAQNRQPT